MLYDKIVKKVKARRTVRISLCNPITVKEVYICKLFRSKFQNRREELGHQQKADLGQPRSQYAAIPTLTLPLYSPLSRIAHGRPDAKAACLRDVHRGVLTWCRV